MLLPTAQEVSNKTYDISFPRDGLEYELAKLFEGVDLPFNIKKLDYSAVVDGWNSKGGIWAPQQDAVQERACAWLYARPKKHILLVTHGAFLHYLTEDWTGDDPIRGKILHLIISSRSRCTIHSHTLWACD